MSKRHRKNDIDEEATNKDSKYIPKLSADIVHSLPNNEYT